MENWPGDRWFRDQRLALAAVSAWLASPLYHGQANWLLLVRWHTGVMHTYFTLLYLSYWQHYWQQHSCWILPSAQTAILTVTFILDSTLSTDSRTDSTIHALLDCQHCQQYSMHWESNSGLLAMYPVGCNKCWFLNWLNAVHLQIYHQ